MKKTMVNAASAFAENKTVAFTPNVSEPAAEVQPAPEAKFAIKSDRKAEPIAAWVWVVVAIAGLAFGLVLNYLS